LAGRGDSPALPRGLRVVFASLRGRIRVAALEHIPGCKRGRLRYRLAAMNINAACGSRPPFGG